MRLISTANIPYDFDFVRTQFAKGIDRFVNTKISDILQVDSNYQHSLGNRTRYSINGITAWYAESELVTLYDNKREISLVSEFIKLPKGVRNMRHYQKVRINDMHSCTVSEELSFSCSRKWLKVLYKPLLLLLLKKRIQESKRFIEHESHKQRRGADPIFRRKKHQPGYSLSIPAKIGNSDPFLSRV